MSAQDFKRDFAKLYSTMESSNDVSKMKHFGVAFTQMFNQVADKYPDLAAATLEFLTGMDYYNFVTMNEALSVASKFINDDTHLSGASEPTKGAHWSMDTLKSFLASKELPLEEMPYYNYPAMWLTVNMIYSDFADALVKITGSKDNEQIATSVYMLAVKKLKDRDRPSFIREYFHL